jgi:hypothetical protein
MVFNQIYLNIQVFFTWIRISKHLDGFVPQIYFVLSRLWLIQTLICMFYCIKVKKFFPTPLNSKHPAILQFTFVLLTHGILYIAEILYTRLIVLSFNSFIHHVVATILFILSLFQQNMICVVTLIPYVIYSFYWYFEAQYDYLLYAYNGALIAGTLIIACFRCSEHDMTLKIAFTTLCLFQFNIFTYFYESELNLFYKVETFKLIKSLIFSFLSTTPFYLYLLNIKKINLFFKL